MLRICLLPHEKQLVDQKSLSAKYGKLIQNSFNLKAPGHSARKHSISPSRSFYLHIRVQQHGLIIIHDKNIGLNVRIPGLATLKVTLDRAFKI